MSGKHIKSEVTAYLNGALTESHRREVEAHLESCEACQALLSKAKAKQARHRRQALKDAAHEPKTNLFLHRIQREAGITESSDGSWWGWILLIAVIAGSAYGLWHKFLKSPLPVAGSTTETTSSDVQSSTATAADVNESTGTAPEPTLSVGSSVAPAASDMLSSTAPALAPEPPPVEAPKFWSGIDSSITDSREINIQARSAWRALWKEMGQTEASPRINFASMMVVGVFTGAHPAGSQAELLDPKDDGESVVIGYRITSSAPTAPLDAASPVNSVVHPYALRTIPRPSRPIRFSEDTSKETTP